MSGYVPNNFDITNPTDAVLAETAQAEFRNIKAFFQGVLARNTGPVTISNSTAPVVVIATTVKGGILGVNRKLRLVTTGTVINTTGGVQTLDGVLSFNGVTALGPNFNIPTGLTSSFRFVMELSNAGATNAQVANGEFHIFSNGSINGVVTSEITGYPVGGGNNAIAIDTTVDQGLQLAWVLGFASASFSVSFETCVVEWL